MDPQQQNPLMGNPLFQAGVSAAQQAAQNALMQGQDPKQAAYTAAQAGVRQAANPDPSQPGGANIQKIAQAIQAKYNLPPDQAQLMAHQVAPMLGGGQGGQPPAGGG